MSVVVAMLVTASLALPATGTATPDASDAPNTDVLVQLHDGIDPAQAAADLQGPGSPVDGRFRPVGPVLAATVPTRDMAALEADPRVAAIESDHPVRATEVATGVARIGALDHEPADIDGDDSRVDVDVAVLDTGVDGSHPDLDVHAGVDCLDGACQAVESPVDLEGHGTHVAGTIGARDDGHGIVGVAPGARIHAVRILDETGAGALSSVMAGLDWVRANAGTIEVANLSLGCECESSMLDELVSEVVAAGVTLVVSAGNEGADAGTTSPANHAEVVTVGAMTDYDGLPGGRAQYGCISDADDTFASYSNHGHALDVVAPGSCIASTLPGGYGVKTGTSMATPHVAGAAALHIAAAGVSRSSARATAVRNALLGQFAVAPDHACGYTDAPADTPMLQLSCVDVDELPSERPELTVVSPVPHASLVAERDVLLTAEALAPESGDLGHEVQWRSDLDGPLGDGARQQVRLSVGDHHLTASVVDAEGRLVAQTVPVTVTTIETAMPRSLSRGCPEGVVAFAGFTDVPAHSLFASAIDCVAWWDVTRGVSAERYDAGGTVTRGQMAAFLTRLVENSGGDLPDTTQDHFDDDGDNAFEDEINRLAAAGLVRGVDAESYDPTGPVTRGQMARFLAAAIEYRTGRSLPIVQNRFDDTGNLYGPAADAIAAAGIAAGTSATTYDPTAPVTRGQMAAFLARTLDLLVDLDVASTPG